MSTIFDLQNQNFDPWNLNSPKFWPKKTNLDTFFTLKTQNFNNFWPLNQNFDPWNLNFPKFWPKKTKFGHIFHVKNPKFQQLLTLKTKPNLKTKMLTLETFDASDRLNVIIFEFF